MDKTAKADLVQCHSQSKSLIPGSCLLGFWSLNHEVSWGRRKKYILNATLLWVHWLMKGSRESPGSATICLKCWGWTVTSSSVLILRGERRQRCTTTRARDRCVRLRTWWLITLHGPDTGTFFSWTGSSHAWNPKAADLLGCWPVSRSPAFVLSY